MAYTTSDIDAIVMKLEAALSKGYAEVTHDGHHLTYRSTDEIFKAIGYFKNLRSSATDAPAQTADTRTFYLFGGGGR